MFYLYSGYSYGACDLQFWGDLFISESRTSKLAKLPQIDPSIAKALDSCSVNVVNFEGVVTSHTEPLDPSKKFLLKSSPKIFAWMKSHNIFYAGLANNHTMDYGWGGASSMLSLFNKHEISYGGIGKSIKEASMPMIINSGEQRICVFSFSRTFPKIFWATETKPGSAGLTSAATIELIKSHRASCDTIIASFHWGAEGAPEPKQYQRELAKRSLRAGADLIIGHHPHTLQGMESFADKAVIYSLGNFIFTSYGGRVSTQGAALQIELNSHKGIKSFYLNPLEVGPRVESVKISTKPTNPTNPTKASMLAGCELLENRTFCVYPVGGAPKSTLSPQP